MIRGRTKNKNNLPVIKENGQWNEANSFFANSLTAEKTMRKNSYAVSVYFIIYFVAMLSFAFMFVYLRIRIQIKIGI